jgi:hypothetical protein
MRYIQRNTKAAVDPAQIRSRTDVFSIAAQGSVCAEFRASCHCAVNGMQHVAFLVFRSSQILRLTV